MATVGAPVIPRHPSTFDKAHKAQSTAAAQPVPSSRPTTTTTKSSGDQYYGHESDAKLCCRFVTHLFACPDHPPQTSATPTTPSPNLAVFIAYALHRTRLPQSVTFAALYLLQRLKQRFPAARGSSGHRLFLSAFMIASKVICDDTYSNKSWCIVGQGMFALREVNQMEREMCAYLDWELNVEPDHLSDFERVLRTNFAGPGPYHAVSLPVPAPKATYVPQEPATITVQTPPQTSPPRPRTSAPRRSSQDELAAATTTAAAARRYPSPQTSPDSPDTPESSHSMSSSPSSTPSPRTPNSIEHAHAHIVAQGSPAQPGAHMNATAALKAQHMVRALQSEPGAPPHFGVPTTAAVVNASEPPVKTRTASGPAKTFSMPRSRGALDPFAFAAPVAW